jgi:hypothetical protein
VNDGVSTADRSGRVHPHDVKFRETRAELTDFKLNDIVTYLMNAFPGNMSVNMILARNSSENCVFHVAGSWRRIRDVTHQQYVAVT